ncbi:type II secretion system protein GspE [Erwiniaceae bacterium BAC15a-03b]|uniref:Type II secretion system protein GspE n=1 Tax=Winslowiella arboricola TaxID=2978220 RepID=A0A9J6PLE7_9GAMM|nr:type II secretion system protein GspE [Winslowiella arboricola]MCU5771461.1 type II secretion system protein GspE [Winslowiella arboricola]MCU5778210.1 type II secretion system protein GspE [Winslowiella arboricola]
METANQRTIQALCQRYQAIILEHNAHRLLLAVSENPAPQMIEALRFASQCHVEIECWPQARIEQYSQQPSASPVARESRPDEAQGASTVELVEQTLQIAVQRRASDIHFEPQANGLRIRLRIDGVLHPLQGSYDNISASLLARLKILGNLDIAERRMPQDGQFSQQINGKAESFRLSTLPVRFGEKAVIRLLQSEAQAIDLDKLGMPAAALQCYRAALARPQGLILVTGPTGSGKTFTLYSGLSALNQPGKNLCSVEDPVEIPLPGINQTQINSKSGLDFHRVLRALLRQDPDVIMLGEIRDGETAEIAIKAAQTGHLVLSTLHTNSTTETLTRLGQMGIPGYLLASALKLVIAQRLVRRLCQRCRQPAAALTHFPPALWPGALQSWRATGCDHCFSGYYGRLALFELLPISDPLQQAIAANATPDELASLAQQQGMNSLFTEGLHAVYRGDTSLEEINRIVGVGDG